MHLYDNTYKFNGALVLFLSKQCIQVLTLFPAYNNTTQRKNVQNFTLLSCFAATKLETNMQCKWSTRCKSMRCIVPANCGKSTQKFISISYTCILYLVEKSVEDIVIGRALTKVHPFNMSHPTMKILANT